MMNWRQVQRTNFTSVEALADYLEFSEVNREQLINSPGFILNLPFRLASKIQKNCLDDPLFRQFVPLAEEKASTLGFIKDPVGDMRVQCTPKLLRKYQGRALIVTTSACAMHCRYCFRKNYPYEIADKTFDEELAVLQADSSIEEVILSGGDPLSLSNERLKELLDRIEQIPHIRKIRFHTRFPVGIPERLDEEFLSLIANRKCQVWFVVHINHPKELDDEVIHALSNVRQVGVPVLNQAVLLKGVNDSEVVLEELFRLLTNHGIFAYYLHQLDKVEGSAHFEVAEARGEALIQHLRETLPGYAVPKYVKEISGEKSKTQVTTSFRGF